VPYSLVVFSTQIGYARVMRVQDQVFERAESRIALPADRRFREPPMCRITAAYGK